MGIRSYFSDDHHHSGLKRKTPNTNSPFPTTTTTYHCWHLRPPLQKQKNTRYKIFVRHIYIYTEGVYVYREKEGNGGREGERERQKILRRKRKAFVVWGGWIWGKWGTKLKWKWKWRWNGNWNEREMALKFTRNEILFKLFIVL